MLVHLNRRGASEYALDQAVQRLAVAGHGGTVHRDDGRRRGRRGARCGTDAPGLDRFHRLALEMSLHEEQERRALGGELAELERAWQEAEEIAAIADACCCRRRSIRRSPACASVQATPRRRVTARPERPPMGGPLLTASWWGVGPRRAASATTSHAENSGGPRLRHLRLPCSAPPAFSA
jgi:hypothetical protein